MVLSGGRGQGYRHSGGDLNAVVETGHRHARGDCHKESPGPVWEATSDWEHEPMD